MKHKYSSHLNPMPQNTLYLLTAYGIVVSVVTIYGIGLMLRLKSITTRLNLLQKTIEHETEES